MSSELYLDLVSKTIISMLSKEIAVDVGTQVGARVNELLNNTLVGLISDQIAAQTDRLGRSIVALEGALKPQISELGAAVTEMSGQIIEKSGLTGEIEEIKGSLSKGLQSHNDVMAEVRSIKEAINEALQRNLGTQIDGVSSKIDAAFADMDNRMVAIVESTVAAGAIKNDLSAALSTIGETLQNNLIGQIVGQIEGISEKIDASVKQSLQSGEEGEMVKGVYYSMKKLINDFNKKRESAIEFNKQYLTSMSDLRKHIEDDLRKHIIDAQEQNTMLKNDIQNLNRSLQHSAKEQNKLLVDILGTIEKQLPFFSGKVDDALSHIEGRITGFERATLSKMTSTSTDFMKFIDENVVNNLKGIGKNYGSVMGGLSEIKQLTDSSVKDQTDMLQGVFLYVKKLLQISEKERDTNEKVSVELTNALDNLYSHIRRLESENDELDVELLRLAGDDYFKNKFKQLENEVNKARSLAEKYQEEKIELEQKYMRLQQEWTLAQELEGK
ncbi:hypothetical protein [Candidatus Magnetominusculus dajiuhuensis]|uniref:hypothetical protein n=1 Tax=Candidatus Magnetominusculus dajiuhuensis TaxID=3137712 RepID=UPI003B431E95